jgi:hypothetical protein
VRSPEQLADAIEREWYEAPHPELRAVVELRRDLMRCVLLIDEAVRLARR